VALRIYFVRHGESQANLDHVFANRPAIKGDLTPVGIAQANALARELSGAGLTQVYTSPLPRARRTATILAMHLGVSLTVTDALREYDVGDFEGLGYGGGEAWRMQRYEAVEQSWRDGNHDASHPGGESLADLTHRFRPFLSHLVSRHTDDDALVAVGHGGLFRALLPSLLQDVAPGVVLAHPLGHGGIVIGEYHGNAWHCLRWGD
jgi:2,3-bisphosphoglycerate-dependent phosphoglycerate mutase